MEWYLEKVGDIKELFYTSTPLASAIIIVVLIGVLLTTVLVALKLFLVFSSGRYCGMENMRGKTVIVTGANGGIGRETCLELAKRGAKVIMACRNLKSGDEAKNDIEKRIGKCELVVKQLDLSSYQSIRVFAEDVNRTENRLDVLIHNAAVALSSVQKSDDGIEMTMATNHFGPFLLTHLLIDLLKKTAPSRIVVVASELYRFTTLDLNNLSKSRHIFPPFIYYDSKYANISFTLELARRLSGTGVTANVLHPGLVNTNIWSSVPAVFRPPFRLMCRMFFKNTTEGCQTSVYASCDESLTEVNGEYFSDCARRSLSAGVKDMSRAKKLWEISETVVGLRENDAKI